MGVVLIAGALFFGYLTALSAWRLFFCPQKDVPGPLLAKLTFWFVATLLYCSVY
jgi:hypothetical protein